MIIFVHALDWSYIVYDALVIVLQSKETLFEQSLFWYEKPTIFHYSDVSVD